MNLVAATSLLQVIVLSRPEILRLMKGTTLTISMEQCPQQDRNTRPQPGQRECFVQCSSKFTAVLFREKFYFWRNSPQWARPSSFTRFLDHTQRRITVGRTPLDE
jgi:hypothetical protein